MIEQMDNSSGPRQQIGMRDSKDPKQDWGQCQHGKKLRKVSTEQNSWRQQLEKL